MYKRQNWKGIVMYKKIKNFGSGFYLKLRFFTKCSLGSSRTPKPSSVTIFCISILGLKVFKCMPEWSSAVRWWYPSVCNAKLVKEALTLKHTSSNYQPVQPQVSHSLKIDVRSHYDKWDSEMQSSSNPASHKFWTLSNNNMIWGGGRGQKREKENSTAICMGKKTQLKKHNRRLAREKKLNRRLTRKKNSLPKPPPWSLMIRP